MDKRGWILVFVFILGLLSFTVDKFVVDNVSFVRSVYLNNFFLGIALISSEIIIFSALTLLFFYHQKTRKQIIPLWLCFLSSVIVGFLLKIGFHRPRPFQAGILSLTEVLIENFQLVWNFAFPSFQAMFCFCALPIIAKEFPKLKYPWFVFAILICASRIYFGLHYLSDVVFGGLVGYVIGLLVIKGLKTH